MDAIAAIVHGLENLAPVMEADAPATDRAGVRFLAWANSFYRVIEGPLQALEADPFKRTPYAMQSLRNLTYCSSMVYGQLTFVLNAAKLLPVPVDIVHEAERLSALYGRATEVSMGFSGIKEAIAPDARLFQIVTAEGLTFLPPLTGSVEPDEDQFLATCLEFPQVYGWGESEASAIEMLRRSINDFHASLFSDDAPLSAEYRQAKNLFKMALK